MMSLKTSALISLGFSAGLLFAADYPTAELNNGQLKVKMYLPDAEKGYYRATRFDWSGAIYSVEYKGHNYYSKWFQSVDPTVVDYSFNGEEVISAPATSMMGPVDEFSTDNTALGWATAAQGDTFIKIGVGVLLKWENVAYHHSKDYPIVDAGKRTVKQSKDSVEFTQEVIDPKSHYGYIYRKVVRLIAGKPQMVLEHSLKNTGPKSIQTTVYNHNFLELDQQSPVAGVTITVPFQIQSARPPAKDVAEIRGNQIVYLRALQNEDRLTSPLKGFGADAKDFDIRIENSRAGAGLRVTGDHPLSSLSLWSIRSTMAVQPFHSMTIEPGQESQWNVTFEYFTLPATAK
jgi:hypothetical protein